MIKKQKYDKEFKICLIEQNNFNTFGQKDAGNRKARNTKLRTFPIPGYEFQA